MGGLYGKRSAEAEPYYGLGYGYGGYGYGGYLYGKRSAEAEAKPYYGYGGYGLGLGYGYAAAPVVEPKDSGLFFTASSGAVTPAFTDAQKEANPEIAEGSESIKVPVVTGVHLIGKREAEPYYGLAMVMGAMAMVAICMERGQLRLRPSPITAMEATDSGSAMAMLPLQSLSPRTLD